MDEPRATLYRKEAVEGQATSLYSKIILVQPPSFRLLTAVSLVFGAAVVLLFMFGSYTRHSTVSGRLLPDRGLINVYAPRSGIVLERHVEENQHVEAGDVLFVVSGERPASLGGEAARSASGVVGVSPQAPSDLLVSKAAELRGQLDVLDRQIDTQKRRVALSQEAVDSYRGLLAKKYISAEQLRQKREELLDQSARLQTLERERIALTHELGTQYMVVTATEAGTVTAITAAVGQAVGGQNPLLSIVPEGSDLHAELYAPSRSVGFVRAGDRVLLRYEAYPYQKFGHYPGTVSWVSKTAVEIPDATGANRSAEPMYLIRVKLGQQSVRAYGTSQPLQAGMAVQADVLQERRRLYEWVLDPLYSLAGRV
ncbi:MAG: HlyD family efflux transporter periplasmic adaptor subunit [Nevskiales bacterium]|nr:HlyD family efflux transporter periplasmic adaptor subunit [Nevskiales bacterium]